MGFFQDLKEDLSQAVNELLPEEELTQAAAQAEDLSDDEDTSVDEAWKEVEAVLSAEIAGGAPAGGTDKEEDALGQAVEEAIRTRDEEAEPAADAPVQAPKEEVPAAQEPAAEKPAEQTPKAQAPAEEKPAEQTPAEQTPAAQEPEAGQSAEETPAKEPIAEAAPMEEKEAEKEVAKVAEKYRMNLADEAVSDETAVITEGMQILGDLISKGSVEVQGVLIGNIEVLGKLSVSGKVEGSSKAAEIFADAAQITGDLQAEGTIKIGENSVVIGDILATSAVIAGAVKGDLDVHGPVILDSNAVVMGNIKSKSVQINNGAVIEGMCSQCYADRSPMAFFEGFVK